MPDEPEKTNISTDETVEYTWDHRNRLTKVTFKDDQGSKTKEIEYVYDIHDRRIAKLLDENGNGTVDNQWHYVYDGMLDPDLANIILVFDASGSLLHRYLHGPDVDQILATEDASGHVLWQLTDHLGTVRDLAEYDAQQNQTSILNHLTYNTFGRITSQSDATKTPLYAFTGREWDPDAEALYYRARWYDDIPGRFFSADPIGIDNPNVNVYLYSSNSPVMHVDPSGLLSICSARSTFVRAERVPGSRWWYPPHAKWRCVLEITKITRGCPPCCTCSLKVGDTQYVFPVHIAIPGLLVCPPFATPFGTCECNG